MRAAEQNRRKQRPTPAIETGLKAHIAILSDQVEQLDERTTWGFEQV